MSDNKRSPEPLTPFPFETSNDMVSADFSSKGTLNRRDSRKAKQLCRQIVETLDLVLSGDCCDELLQSLHVMSVEPAPHVRPPGPAPPQAIPL